MSQPPGPPNSDRLSAFEHRYIRIGMSVLTIVGFTVFLYREIWHLLEPIVGP